MSSPLKISSKVGFSFIARRERDELSSCRDGGADGFQETPLLVFVLFNLSRPV